IASSLTSSPKRPPGETRAGALLCAGNRSARNTARNTPYRRPAPTHLPTPSIAPDTTSAKSPINTAPSNTNAALPDSKPATITSPSVREPTVEPIAPSPKPVTSDKRKPVTRRRSPHYPKRRPRRRSRNSHQPQSTALETSADASLARPNASVVDCAVRLEPRLASIADQLEIARAARCAHEPFPVDRQAQRTVDLLVRHHRDELKPKATLA
ncbi:hypothetical protein SAMN05192530_1181, partial [Aureimonas jatrophae]